MARRKNTFAKAVRHLKSTKFDAMEAAPINSTMGYMASGIAGLPKPDVARTIQPLNFDQDGQGVADYDGKDTTGLFLGDGTILTATPPGDNSYILGPMSAMFYNYSSPWTRIGYIRQSDRRMVNLGSIVGKLSEWDGSSNFTSYGQLTLEQAVWFRDLPKGSGMSNDPSTYTYRAFYPGPPSSVPDEHGRYYCVIGGTPKDIGVIVPDPGKTEPDLDTMDPNDVFSAIMDKIGKGKKLSDEEKEWLEDQGLDDFYKGGLTKDTISDLVDLGIAFAAAKALIPLLKAGGAKAMDYAKGLGKWWNKGRNVNLANENNASWWNLIKDDFAQVGKFSGGKGKWYPRNFAELKQAFSGEGGIFWSFSRGVKTGPTPLIRQAFERLAKFLALEGQTPEKFRPGMPKIGQPIKSPGKRYSPGVGRGGGGEARIGIPGMGDRAEIPRNARPGYTPGDEHYDDQPGNWNPKSPDFGKPRVPETPGKGKGGGRLKPNPWERKTPAERDRDIHNISGPGGNDRIATLPGFMDRGTGGKGDGKMYAGGSPDFDERTGKYKPGKGPKAGKGRKKSVGSLPGSKGPKGGGKVYAGGSKDFDERSGRYRTASYYPEGEVLSESRKSVIKNLKKPVNLPKEQTKFKVKPKVRGLNSAIISKPVDVPKEYQPKGGRNQWGRQEYDFNTRQSQERMNEVLELVGEGEHAFEYMLTDSKKKNAEEMEKFWGLHPELYSYFYNGKKYKELRKEELKGDYIVFLIDEDGKKCSMLQSELNEKMAEEREANDLAEYNKIMAKKEPISFEKDYMFKKAYKRVKPATTYKGKPATKGYPDEPPPEMVNNRHPDFGKAPGTSYYNKLDPQTAAAMPKQDDPTIDAKVKQAKDNPKIDGPEFRRGLQDKVKKQRKEFNQEGFSDWRSELTLTDS